MMSLYGFMSLHIINWRELSTYKHPRTVSIAFITWRRTTFPARYFSYVCILRTIIKLKSLPPNHHITSLSQVPPWWVELCLTLSTQCNKYRSSLTISQALVCTRAYRLQRRRGHVTRHLANFKSRLRKAKTHWCHDSSCYYIDHILVWILLGTQDSMCPLLLWSL